MPSHHAVDKPGPPNNPASLLNYSEFVLTTIFSFSIFINPDSLQSSQRPPRTTAAETNLMMGILSRYLAIPRPRRFLYFMSLRTGVEMIFLSVIFNKVTGFFGLLAILTGLQLSPLQLSMYIYSCGALILLAFLLPHIRQGSPFQNLALAYFYVIDTVVNTAFTSAFAITWFLAVSADQANEGIPKSAPGGGTIGDTAGFTSPKYNVSQVDVVVSENGQEAVGLAGAGLGAATTGSPSLGHGVGIEESIPSLLLVALFTIVRIYFIFVVMAYARQVLRSHVYAASNNQTKLHLHMDGAADMPADNPFKEENAEGKGWRGKAGRVMIGIGESYWLGGQADESWTKGLDGRFKASRVQSGPPGTIERERRARSGTGPPKPSVNLGKL